MNRYTHISVLKALESSVIRILYGEDIVSSFKFCFRLRAIFNEAIESGMTPSEFEDFLTEEELDKLLEK